MKRNNYLKNKTNQKLNIYSGAPINKGFYQRNLNQAKKLYMDQYDRLKQQILKRRKDHEFQELLSGYYKDYNKITKKLPYLSKNEDYKEINTQKNFNLNEYELKKKNINAMFFKYNKVENDLDFEFTDKLIESMNDGSNMTYLNCLEIKEDYKKRLSGKKTIELNSINNNNSIMNNNNQNDNIKNNNNKNNLLKTENKISLSIISDKKDEEKILEVIQPTKKKEIDEQIILTKTKNLQEQNLKKSEEINQIEEEEIDELTRYKNYLKKNKFPCYQNLLNPNNPTDYIPPTFIPDIPKSENAQEKEPLEKNEEYEYNDFEDNFNNKDENILKKENNNIINNQFHLIDNIIKEDIKGENSNSQNNIKITESKKDNNIEEDYEKGNFDDKLNTNSNKINENKSENISNGEINQNNNGDLKMLTDVTQDDKYPKFERIINPYYQTNYLPPDIFIKPNEPEPEKSLELENKYIESQMNMSELDKKINTDDENNNNSNLPILEEKIIDNENPMLENVINSNFNNNLKDNFNIKNDNKEENKEENNNIIASDNQGNAAIYNQFGVNMGNNFVSVENMIKVNQDIPNNNTENKKEDEKKEEDEYNDFEVDN